jgi:hypothetical protein
MTTNGAHNDLPHNFNALTLPGLNLGRRQPTDHLVADPEHGAGCAVGAFLQYDGV